MDIFSIISLLGGFALFLYGMNIMSQGLEKLAGGQLETILRTMTSNKYKSLFLGLSVTAVIQSSSAVTVMLVGLVNSGIMSLQQSIGVIMGSNIGTTVTAWILSLIGVSSNNVWIKLLNPDAFSPILALIGVIMMMVAKSNKKKDAGTVMIGFAVLMYGMSFMSDAMAPLKDMPEFTRVLTAFNNPLLGVLAGTLFTAVIQSSSASVGILQALSLTNGLTYGMVIPIIMGQNIGTCVTAIISSIGVNRNAKRVAAVHITFNVLGTAIFMAVFYAAHYALDFKFIEDTVGPVGIAVVHSLFNIFTTAILFPFTKQLESISNKLVKSKGDEIEEREFLDKRLLNTPSVAVQEALEKTKEMMRIAFANLADSIVLSDSYSDDLYQKIKKREHNIDYFEDQLGSFNVQLSHSELSDRDSASVSMMLHTITDVERIGDHAYNIAQSVEELHSKKINFSEDAKSELRVISSALNEIVEHTRNSFINDDIDEALLVEPIEEVIDDLAEKIQDNHIERLQKGQCTIELGFILNDILNNMERTSDHCSNIAATMIELTHNHLFTHEYIHRIKAQEDHGFADMYNEYSRKYHI